MSWWSDHAWLKPLPTNSVSTTHSIQNFFRESSGSIGKTGISASLVCEKRTSDLMCPPDISSLKWGDDGDLSPNDTLNLVEKLTRAEQESKEAGGATLNSSSLSKEDPS